MKILLKYEKNVMVDLQSNTLFSLRMGTAIFEAKSALETKLCEGAKYLKGLACERGWA